MKRAVNWLAAALFSVYLLLVYYVLLVPAFADYSYFAFLSIPLAFFGFWLVPGRSRKMWAVLALLTIFIEQAVANIRTTKPLAYAVSVTVMVLALYLLARWYARIRFAQVIIVTMAALALHLSVPTHLIPALTEFVPRWSSGWHYTGPFPVPLPLNVADIDEDGKDEIVTLGNRDFYPDGRKLPNTYKLFNEPLRAIAWKWDGQEMVRVPLDHLDRERLEDILPEQYTGFPYYHLNADYELEPLVQRKPFTEGMLQFGTAPYRALLINLENVFRRLELTGGVYDRMAQGGAYENVSIAGGFIQGQYQGQPFSALTSATEIIGAVRMPDGSDALLVRGRNVQLMQMRNGNLEMTHELTREMQRDLSYSLLRAADVDGDGADEVIIDYPYTAILKPLPDGTWKILWASESATLLNIKDIGSFTGKGEPEIIALNKSRVRASGVQYLGSFQYTENGLKQNWKVFIRNAKIVRLADLEGDGRQELVLSFAGSSNVYVLNKHNVPVTAITLALTVLLYAVLIGRRLFHALRSKRSTQDGDI